VKLKEAIIRMRRRILCHERYIIMWCVGKEWLLKENIYITGNTHTTR
jgi:hypothetical protein